ncbi:MAG: hypothetical protein ACRDK9_07535 [Solirubrobacterales bacterium]
MRRLWIAAAVVLVALVASQLAIPGLAASEVEDRLTENGGEADASASAFPALRLLFGDGDRLDVEASGLALELGRETEAFDRLDGFGEVEIAIADFAAGPISVERFELIRDGSAPYRLTSSGEASPAELVELGAESLGLPGGGLAGLAFDDQPVPVELDMELASEDGEVEVVSGEGTIAGISTGVLGELITEAIVSRL